MTNLSYEVTSFVGREEELAMLWREWQNARLITLTGPAGAGKTRLALRFASELVLDHPEGVWRVDLADITKDQRVASAVSATLGTRTSGNDMVQAVVNQLRKSSVFLVFDNCDQARTGCRDVAATILQNCPRVHILATSREALGAAEETIVQLSPLSIPDRHSGLSEPAQQKSTAVKLFVDRAKAVTSGFHLSERNVSNVADICRKLDGIPLAIELVAARSQGLSARDLLRRIDRRLGNASVQPHGHSSNEEKINSTIEWSYEALSPLGQEVLQRLTVFVGGWTLEDAEAICSDDEVQAVQIREQLRDLVEKSLVSVSVNDDDSSRFTCLDIIREYVIAQRAGKDFTALKRRHASYYALKARELSKIPPGVAISESLASLYRERGNVGAALEYLLTTGAQEEATAIRESFRQFLGDTPPVPGKP